MRTQRRGAASLAVACLATVVLGWAARQFMHAAIADADVFAGKVLGANSPISGSAVTLYAAGTGKPVQLAQGKTEDDGTFKLAVGADRLKDSADKVLYLVARGGTPKAAGAKGPNDAIALMSESEFVPLSTKVPDTVAVSRI